MKSLVQEELVLVEVQLTYCSELNNFLTTLAGIHQKQIHEELKMAKFLKAGKVGMYPKYSKYK